MEKERVIRIAVLGAESTGKTALCQSLAEHFNTVWVPEYAREYFNDSDIYNYTPDDLVKIAQKQLELESEFSVKANKFLFCDTTLITLKIWAELEFNEVPYFIEENLLLVKYDHYLLTDNSIPWVKDELRQNKFSREMILEMNLDEVQKLSGSYSIIRGDGSLKVKQAIEVLKRL